MRHCHRFFVLFTALVALSAGGLSGFTSSPNAFAALPGASSKPGTVAEWTGELPTPPQQTAPWTPPKGARSLPPYVLDTAQTLFAQGLADPRGGDYQTITVHVGNVWNGGGGVVETRGWVLPHDTNGQKFAVCWNGLVYPVVAVKGHADLDSDAGRMVKKLGEWQTKAPRSASIFLFSLDADSEAKSLELDHGMLLKSFLLLRLDKPALARSAVQAWEKNGPINAMDDARHDPYGPLAVHWAWTLYDRAVCAHMRGADAVALADTNLLLRVQPMSAAEAAKRGYKTTETEDARDPRTRFLGFLDNLPKLQKDAARRVAEPPRPPIDWVALKKKPQAERIAFLISRLDDVAARQSGQPGGVGLDDDPVSQALIAEGAAAVEPLFDAMEHDTRLTRSVSFGRDFFRDRQLHYVSWAASACVNRITQVSQISDKNGMGRTMAVWREWWAKNKGLSPADRWYAQLSDDGPTDAAPPAPPGTPRDQEAERKEWERLSNIARNKQHRWEEAAKSIVERSNIRAVGMWVTSDGVSPGQTPPPFKGESLRTRTNPSVSDLLRKRALQLSEPVPEKWGFDYAAGANFALRLYEWDSKGAQTLPTLQEVMRRCLDYQHKQERGQEYSEQYQMGGRIARLTLARVYLGDDAAASEYGAWLRTVTPQYLGFETKSSLHALWREPENPALKTVADRLFSQTLTGGARPTIWSRMLSSPGEQNHFLTPDLARSDLIVIPAFQTLLVNRLFDQTPAGFVTQKGRDENSRRFEWIINAPQSAKRTDDRSLQKQSVRICDRVAAELRYLAGCPPFNPLASVEERDRQCAAIAAFLQRWGASLHRAGQTVSISPLYSYDTGDWSAYLGPTFRIADRPATEADVRENRAIFYLRGRTTRIALDLPAALPIEAQWNKDPNPDVAYQFNIKQVPYSHGLIWQAEDEWNGKTWTRYYGYVGPHGFYKVPAREIELTDWRVLAAQKARAATRP